MSLRLYNTLTQNKDIFKPIKKGEVGMYVCGPTVNGVPHLGHARQQITFDILRRYLEYSGYKVNFVSNITDIDDKIIKVANEKRISIKELSKKNLKEHLEDYESIGVKSPNQRPRATEYIKEMISLIKKLEDKNYTYILEGDGIYYDVSKFKEYGKLSHQKLKDLKAGARIKIKSKKRNNQDFVVWKFSKENEPSWKSPWGEGRPGWHIECSAMSEKLLGLPFDIHGGGQDLIFPHHEDEIAQSEAAFEKELAKYWIHNGFVNVEKIKMSKSLGNYKTIKDVLKEYSGEIIRYFVISSHYRKPIDFSKKLLEVAKTSYTRLKNIITEIENDGKLNKKYLKEFENALDDDMNTPNALQSLWKMVRDKNATGKIKTLEKMDEVLGLNLFEVKYEKIPEQIRKIVEKREHARDNKEWELADELRDKIHEKGYSVSDSAEGPLIRKLE